MEAPDNPSHGDAAPSSEVLNACGDECVEARAAGSNGALMKPGRSPITVAMHRGKTLKEGTASAILKQAGVSEGELFDVY